MGYLYLYLFAKEQQAVGVFNIVNTIRDAAARAYTSGR